MRSNATIIRHIGQLRKQRQREITEATPAPGLQQCLDKEEDFTNKPGVQDSRLFQRTQTLKVMKVTISVAPDFAFHPLFLLLFLIFCFLTGNS